ncbi:UNVERIFIED_CONTAM: Pentatricopeptide repeat-containing protein, chloroplastic [Sesamum radiatum]|uniref:Pentatricopeptide repeat-containing protein, chloroplastic n=1 Tax=Sesamum radiatum TaxID=300843 RepID=A0AAW2MVT2_SESRA
MLLLSNMYAEVGRWEDVDRVRYLLKKQGLERTTGCSIVECNGKTYKFTNHDRSQTESNIIYAVLDILSRKVGEDPYVHSAYKFKPPDLLRRRDNSPMCHSVRLAICFGLIGTSIGEPVVIRKNIRICEDCHRATKRISEITNREIVVGDPKIYHHFKDGRCSCGDYWGDKKIEALGDQAGLVCINAVYVYICQTECRKEAEYTEWVIAILVHPISGYRNDQHHCHL